LLGDTSPEGLRAVREYASERGIGFVLPAGRASEAGLREALQAAAHLGANTVGCTLSGILCGDRRGFEGGWRSHVEQCAGIFEAVLPEAERLGIAIAIENHQDAASEDLLQLCRRFESRYLGVNLDCGNALSVVEEPVEFATRLGPYLRHSHLKDYRVHPAP